jgi:preprotein translocase SecE subunit
MYKWPQGRVIRVVSFILVGLIVIDLGWVGAHGQLDAYSSADHASVRSLVLGCIYAALALAVLIAGLVGIGFKAKSVDFLIEVETEMTRVTWPTGSDLWRATIVIALMIAVLGLAIFAVDSFNLKILFQALYGSRS